jgi:hypothetical protein
MRQLCTVMGFFLALVGAAVRGDDESLRLAMALEASVQKVIERVEPSIASILVSRSELYAQFEGGGARAPGRLGGLQPATSGASTGTVGA